MEFLGYSQEYLYAQIRLLQLHSEQLSYADFLCFPHWAARPAARARSAAENMAGQTAGLWASPGMVLLIIKCKRSKA